MKIKIKSIFQTMISNLFIGNVESNENNSNPFFLLLKITTNTTRVYALKNEKKKKKINLERV
jgi:hypothetical protein